MYRILSLLLVFLLVGMAGVAEGQSATDREAKIINAASAAPPAISAQATIKDWDGTVLRRGNNGWTCYPAMPNARSDNPMCLDEQWVDWLEAFMNGEEPNITDVGLGYMLRGGEPNSNLDPSAEGPTSDNQWMDEVKPHVMMLFPDHSMYDNIPVDHKHGGPWVMFPNTPYVHIMMPVD